MNTSKLLKLQYLLIDQLLKEGSVELMLPDGITLEIGITQEDKNGEQKKADDYCYVVATRDDKSVILDTYNLGLQFGDNPDTIICEDVDMDQDGYPVRFLDVV